MKIIIGRGNRGYRVTWAQRILKASGHYHGELDGDYGPKTEAAVRQFQTLRGLRSSGRVDEGLWQTMMDLPESVLNPGAVSVECIHLIVPLAPAGNVARHWPTVHEALHRQGLCDWPMLAHAIATVGVETEVFAPIVERGTKKYFEGLYERRRDLGNTVPGDGYRYRGRGFVQITGRSNYRLYGRLLGVELENEPDLALEPVTAARILAAYLCRHEARLRRALDTPALDDDRRVVNGGTNGLESFGTLFGRALKYLPL